MVKSPTSRDRKTISFSRGATSERSVGEGKLKPLITSKGNITEGSESGGGKAKGGKKKKRAKRRD